MKVTKDELLKQTFLENYLGFTQWQEAPDDFHLWISCTLIAAATQRQVFYNQGDYFKLYPNLYTGIVAESAICRKTSAMDIGMEIYCDALEESMDTENILRGKITPPALIAFLCPKVERVTSGSIFIQADELEVFFSKDVLNLGLVGLLTTLYTCPKRHQYYTKHQGQYNIRDAFVNVLGGAVPSYMTNSVGSVFEAGLIGRFSFVHKEEPKARIARISTVAKPEVTSLYREVLVEQIQEINRKSGGFEFTDEAGELYDKWYEKIPLREKEREDGIKTLSSGFVGRKGDHALKLAMILHLSRRVYSDAVLRLEAKDILAGMTMAERAGESLREIFENIPTGDLFKRQAEVEELIRGKKRISAKFYARNFYKRIDPDMRIMIILSLETAGLVTTVREKDETYYYYIDDDLRDLDAEHIKKEVMKRYQEGWKR